MALHRTHVKTEFFIGSIEYRATCWDCGWTESAPTQAAAQKRANAHKRRLA